ncbi:hypothetical protein [Streptomyces sp. NPDC005181]|uniref:hypothetical protein n=1 Tax=Streptomyces sp. NPDC005181 TaxID=3156869 RepID=UPI0033A40FB1
MMWVLSGFGADESLCSEHPISKEQLVKVREVVPPAPDDSWYVHSYRVPHGALHAMGQILQCQPLDRDVEYFVDGYAAG